MRACLGISSETVFRAENGHYVESRCHQRIHQMLRTHSRGLVATNSDFLAFQLVEIQIGALCPDDDLGMSRCEEAGEDYDGEEEVFHGN